MNKLITVLAVLGLVPVVFAADEAGKTPYTWLKFDNLDVGVVATDNATSFTNEGSYTGEAKLTVSDGEIVEVEGVNRAWQYGSKAYSPALAPNSSIVPTTYSARFNLNGQTYDERVVWGWNGTAYGGVCLRVTGNPTDGYAVKVAYHDKTCVNSGTVYISYSVPADKVEGYHLYTVVSSSTSSRILYVDGLAVGTSITTLSKTQNANFGIGTGGNNGGTYAPTGLLVDEMRIYSEALSATDVKKIAGIYRECTATVEAGEVNWSDIVWTCNGEETQLKPTDVCTLTASMGAIIHVSSTVSVAALTVTGGTLALSDDGFIDVNDFTGSFTGSGTVKATSYAKAASYATSLQASTWTGTLYCYGIDINDGAPGSGPVLMNWGNANSKIKFTGTFGWLGNGTVASEVVLADEGDTKALTIDDGSSGSQWIYGFKKISGSGTLRTTHATGTTFRPLRVENLDDFTGSIVVTKQGVVVGTGATDTSVVGNDNTTVTALASKITVVARANVTLASGATWQATDGIVVKGTLNLVGNVASAIKGDGTVVIAGQTAGNTMPAAASSTVQTSLQDANNWTGTLWIKGGNNVALKKLPVLLGNANSKVKMTGVKGWLGTDGVWNFAGELVLEDEGDMLGLYLTSSQTTRTITAARLSGSGTFRADASKGTTFTFTDASDFTGTFELNGTDNVVIGSGATAESGNVVVASGATVGLCKAWTATGVIVNGTLKIGAELALTIPVTMNDGSALEYAGLYPLTLSSLSSLEAATVSVTLSSGLELSEKTYSLLSVDAIPTVDFTWTNAEAYPRYRLHKNAQGLSLGRIGFSIIVQ